MSRKRTSTLVAAAALAVGAGAGAGGYAALAGGGSSTTTVVQPATRASTAAATTTNSLSVQDVYKRTYQGVVEITATTNGSSSSFPFDRQQSQQAQGSGFVYDSSGDIVTNYHVIEGASSLKITFWDGSSSTATVVGSDPSTDLALLKVDAPASKLHPLVLADSSKVQVGDGVVAIGSPFGLEETVTSGIVSALNRTISSVDQYSISGAIQTDAAINHGNSGGPLLNLQGQVIGITSQIESDSNGNEGVGFAISSNTVRSVVSQLVAGHKVQHAFLGVSVQAPANGSGARIASVRSGSPAAAAGLRAGDVITEFDRHAITTVDDLTGAVQAKQPGDKVTVTYVRSGQTHSVQVTLGSR
jgi:putative serine protease PepD